ncbi:MAG: PDZ domain-containing protein [Mariniblastus sp.]
MIANRFTLFLLALKCAPRVVLLFTVAWAVQSCHDAQYALGQTSLGTIAHAKTRTLPKTETNQPSQPTRFEVPGFFEVPIEPAVAFGKHTLEIQSALKPIAEKYRHSIVQFESSQGRRSLGTVVADGLIVGKRSELGNSFYCLVNGEKIPATMIGHQSDHDLALVQISPTDDGTKLVPIQFPIRPPTQFLSSPSNSQPPGTSSMRIGKLVASLTGNSNSSKLGMVSVAPQQFGIKQPKTKDGIDLGAVVSPFRTTKLVMISSGDSVNQVHGAPTLISTSGLEVTRVYPRTISERSGLLVGDLIQTANGISISTAAELNSFGRNLRVGQMLELVVIRDGKTKTLSNQISDFAPRIFYDRWGGGPFSKKRFGFQQVISHDTDITPSQCGGPLVDLEGNIVGINISRAMRVSTFSIPIKSVFDFVSHVRPDAKFRFQD